jgi:hypothetical protein
MGTATGRKPPTSGLGNRCFIQLSYGDVRLDIASDADGVCLHLISTQMTLIRAIQFSPLSTPARHFLGSVCFGAALGQQPARRFFSRFACSSR